MASDSIQWKRLGSRSRRFRVYKGSHRTLWRLSVRWSHSEFLALLSGASAPVQPIFHFEDPPERIRLKSPTPAKEVLYGRFCLCSHPPGHFLIVGAGGNEVSQQLCRQSSRLKKSAVHRAVEDRSQPARGALRGTCRPVVRPTPGTRPVRRTDFVAATRFRSGAKARSFSMFMPSPAKGKRVAYPGRDRVDCLPMTECSLRRVKYLRVAPAITQQPREGRDQSKEHSLQQAWWPGKLDHIAELTGEDHQLEKIWHPLSIDPSILGKAERIENHDFEPGSRTNLNANNRIFVSRRSTSRAEHQEGRAT